jgi:hypothetical protein
MWWMRPRLAWLLLPLVLLGACGSDSPDVPKATGRAASGAAPAWRAPADPVDRARAAKLEPEVRETLKFHAHTHLDVFFNGKSIVVPAGIGINIADPGVKKFKGTTGTAYGRIDGCDQPCISPLHTHEPDGILHTESADTAPNTLGQFFAEWGVALDTKCVGEYCAPETDLAVFVDGKRFRGDPASIRLTDRKEIAILIGTPPPDIPTTADFAGA